MQTRPGPVLPTPAVCVPPGRTNGKPATLQAMAALAGGPTKMRLDRSRQVPYAHPDDRSLAIALGRRPSGLLRGSLDDTTHGVRQPIRPRYHLIQPSAPRLLHGATARAGG